MRAEFGVFVLTAVSVVASAIGLPRDVKHDLVGDLGDLFRRRGGGAAGGKGSHSGAGKGGSHGSSSSNTGSRSNAGGTSSKGSGPQPSLGHGQYYPGGGSVPYESGSEAPGGLLPIFLDGDALAFWPGVWLYGAYLYDYNSTCHFYNTTTAKNETLDIICGCSHFEVCACDNNKDDLYYEELIGNGSYSALNHSILAVAKVNGSETLLINGTLPNGTTAAKGAGRPLCSASNAVNLGAPLFVLAVASMVL